MSHPVHYFQVFVDNTKDHQFQGNSAAVVQTDEPLDTHVMQAIAANLTTSATAFICQQFSDATLGSNNVSLFPHFLIRWFSSVEEIQFCGHGTLAAAFMIFDQQSTTEIIRFSSPINASIIVEKHSTLTNNTSNPLLIGMTLDIDEPKKVYDIPNALLALIANYPSSIHEVYKNQSAYFLISSDESTVNELTPDISLLQLLIPHALIVTAPSTSISDDFVLRYFWVNAEGGEDSVTGSAQTGLAPLWSKRLQKKELTSRQLSKQGGIIHCELNDTLVTISGYVCHQRSDKKSTL